MAHLFALLLTLSANAGFITAAATTVYRCHVAGEAITFADRPCKGGIAVKISPGTTIAMAPLTEEEEARLQAVTQASKQRASQLARDRDRVRAKLARQTDQAATACQAARTELRALKIRRRQGYTLAEAAKIGKRADSLKETIRNRC